jgi:hypothetical protein
VGLEKPSVEDMHGFDSREEDWIPIRQIEKRRPSETMVPKKGLLLDKTPRIPPTLCKLDLLNNISFWPGASVKVFYILDVEIAASTKFSRRGACKSASLTRGQHIRDNRNKNSTNSATLAASRRSRIPHTGFKEFK